MKSLLATLILIAASTTFAGTADQDPVAAQLRSRFAQAFVPNASQLKLGKTWQCREVTTHPNESYTFANSVSVTSIDGLFEINNNDIATLTPQGLVYTDISSGLQSSLVIRIDKQKNLLIERSVKVLSDANPVLKTRYSAKYDKSVAIAGSLTVSYAVCVLDN